MDGLAIRYWVDGGWGVDILAGRRTRRHRDLDIDYDSRETARLLSSLNDAGFVVETDMMPVRMELHHQELGYLDIHPFELFPDGSARQADGQGGWFEFTPDLFGSAVFAGRPRLRSAYLSVKIYMPWLWTWYNYTDQYIPNTNNGVEGVFSDLNLKRGSIVV